MKNVKVPGFKQTRNQCLAGRVCAACRAKTCAGILVLCIPGILVAGLGGKSSLTRACANGSGQFQSCKNLRPAISARLQFLANTMLLFSAFSCGGERFTLAALEDNKAI